MVNLSGRTGGGGCVRWRPPPSTFWPALAWEETARLQALRGVLQEQAVEQDVLTVALLVPGWALLLRWRFDLRLAPRPAVNPAQAALEPQKPLSLVIELIEASDSLEASAPFEREAR